jgi:hypothetical protein
LIYGSAALPVEISFRSHSGQDGIVVLFDLVSGYSRGALRPIARIVAQLIRNKRNCWLRFTFERSTRTLHTVKPLADAALISYAVLCFELFRSHQRPRVYLDTAVATERVIHVPLVMRRLCRICARSEAISTACSRLTIGWSDRGSRLRWAKEGIDDWDKSAFARRW